MTPALVKGLCHAQKQTLPENQKGKHQRISKNLMPCLMLGIIGSIGIKNIGMEDGGQSLISRSIIIWTHQ